MRRRLAVVAGGPGTGKTTTVARIAALLAEQAAAAGAPPPLIALAAPTGKAAARLEEAVHDEARRSTSPTTSAPRCSGSSASTLHRLLGRRRGSHSRFRHDRGNRLPHDVVVVDETSMVSLSLMARLVEAVRPDARLVLVGDPGQLSSIEAGAVLGDIVGAGDRRGDRRARPRAPLRRRDRGLAGAIRDGDADAALEVLREAPEGVDVARARRRRRRRARAGPPPRRRRRPRGLRTPPATATRRAALDALGAFRLLCAHRRGPYGVAAWGPQVEGWLAADVARLLAPTSAGTRAARCW